MPLAAPPGDAAAGRGAAPSGAGAALLRPLAGDRMKRSRRRRIDALVPVVPPDPVPGGWVGAEDLLDHAHTFGSLRRLGLGGDPVSYLELHSLTSRCCAS